MIGGDVQMERDIVFILVQLVVIYYILSRR